LAAVNGFSTKSKAPSLILIAIAMSPILQQPLKDGEVKNKIVHDENINLGCDLIEVLSRRSVRRRLFPP
jgi:hypothetical protein